ncbi:MAG: hypothetical protein MUO27_03380 [Sedimentisphaerales bacterium]|nr:hypothetical protein [Sedimentisphaerales bacterium]
MKFLIGLVVGVCFVLVTGAAVERYIVVLEGDFGKVGAYQSAFSGVSAEGNCYLAITNTRTGRTEVFGITKETNKKLSDNSLQMSREGSIIAEPQETLKRP